MDRTTIIFCWINVRIFLTKNISLFVFKILTKRLQPMSLLLNKWPQAAKQQRRTVVLKLLLSSEAKIPHKSKESQVKWPYIAN